MREAEEDWGRVTDLLLKRAATSRPSGKWNDDDYDVLADGEVVGRIYKANAAPVGSPWMCDAVVIAGRIKSTAPIPIRR
jgi:hypothetical protein